jgi:sugar lactone lactonase YvrE
VRWVDTDFTWTELSPPWPTSALGWSHTDVAVTGQGDLVTAHPDGGALVWISPDGTAVTTTVPIMDAHGLAVSADPVQDTVWLADNGTKLVAEPHGRYTVNGSKSGQVLHVDRTGRVLNRLPRPDGERFRDADYMPTAVLLIEGTHGPVWVADGYGSSVVHRFSNDGRLELSITGEDSGIGAFDCPHAMLLDHRRGNPELYIADRGRNRLVVLDLEGAVVRVVETAELVLPSALVLHGDVLLVAELPGRLTVLDVEDRVIGRLGDNMAATVRPGWPNSVTEDGIAIRPDDLSNTKLNSPHGLVVDAAGRLIVTEWLMGGRLLAIERRESP